MDNSKERHFWKEKKKKDKKEKDPYLQDHLIAVAQPQLGASS